MYPTEQTPRQNIYIMVDSPPPNSTASRRPQLRCPACTRLVTLPAQNCPHCQVNLRDGTSPHGNNSVSEPGRRLRILVGAVMLLVIISLSFIVLRTPGQDPAPTMPPSEPQQTEMGEIFDSFDHVPQSRSLNPTPILNNAKNVARNLEEQNIHRDHIINTQ